MITPSPSRLKGYVQIRPADTAAAQMAGLTLTGDNGGRFGQKCGWNDPNGVAVGSGRTCHVDYNWPADTGQTGSVVLQFVEYTDDGNTSDITISGIATLTLLRVAAQTQQQQQSQQQQQEVACTGWDSTDITMREGGYKEMYLGMTPVGCSTASSNITFDIEVKDRIRNNTNYGKPYRDGCAAGLIVGDHNPRNVPGADPPKGPWKEVLGIRIYTDTGRLEATPCDDNTIVERQVVIRDTNSTGGAETKTITITDDDSYHPMQPTAVDVQRQSAVQNLPADVYPGYDSNKAYTTGEKVFHGIYTWTRNDRVLKNGKTQPAPGSEIDIKDHSNRSCVTGGNKQQLCWDRSYVRYDSAGIDVLVGRAYHAPYRLLITLGGAAHPQGLTDYTIDGTELVINLPDDDNGFTRKSAWFSSDVTCHNDGPGWIKVQVWPQTGGKFDTHVWYKMGVGYSTDDYRLQICW